VDAPTAILAGLGAGLAIAMQVGAVSVLLAGHEAEIRLVAAAALAAIAIHGLIALWRDREPPGPLPAGRHYSRFLGITVANPLTIASFAAVAASLSLAGPLAAGAFALGVGAASAAWHLVLGLAAGHGGRRLTPRLRRHLAVGGRVAVLAFAVHLGLAA
jgi:hypothetical protein